eukprot:SAG31_NODE_6838_length_1874_cov_1.015775_2_plen_123_part_00
MCGEYLGGQLVSLHSFDDFRALAHATALSGVSSAVYVGAHKVATNDHVNGLEGPASESVGGSGYYQWQWHDGTIGLSPSIQGRLNEEADELDAYEDQMAFCGSASCPLDCSGHKLIIDSIIF